MTHSPSPVPPRDRIRESLKVGCSRWFPLGPGDTTTRSPGIPSFQGHGDPEYRVHPSVRGFLYFCICSIEGKPIPEVSFSFSAVQSLNDPYPTPPRVDCDINPTITPRRVSSTVKVQESVFMCERVPRRHGGRDLDDGSFLICWYAYTIYN